MGPQCNTCWVDGGLGRLVDLQRCRRQNEALLVVNLCEIAGVVDVFGPAEYIRLKIS